jgi:hypothetical protein
MAGLVTGQPGIGYSVRFGDPSIYSLGLDLTTRSILVRALCASIRR